MEHVDEISVVVRFEYDPAAGDLILVCHALGEVKILVVIEQLFLYVSYFGNVFRNGFQVIRIEPERGSGFIVVWAHE